MKPAPGMADYAAWYQRHRARLTDRGQALDGGEPGRAGGMSFEAARFRLLICRSLPMRMCANPLRTACFFIRATGSDVYVDLAFLPERRDASGCGGTACLVVGVRLQARPARVRCAGDQHLGSAGGA
jgi:hypothetical protein